MSYPDSFTVAELKVKLKKRGLRTTGNKNELINRLMQEDPTGSWIQSCDEVGDSDENNDVSNHHDDDTSTSVANGTRYGFERHYEGGVSGVSASMIDDRERQNIQRELEISRKEKALAERELELVRRELATLQSEHLRQSTNREDSSVNNSDSSAIPQFFQSRVNITAIADLLHYFDGKSEDYETWEKQIRFLKTTYKLEDDLAKIILGMRLKGKAHEWFHSKPEYISLTFESLLVELRSMFCHRLNKMVIRRKFEDRIWKKNETFHEYVHEKIILGNRVPIDENELLDYVVEGIPDSALRDQARLQRFN